MLPVLAAREVSQRGGGARRWSEAPELMSPAGAKSKRSGRSDVWLAIADAFRTLRRFEASLPKQASGFLGRWEGM